MLTPTQILEQMLKQVADFDAAHVPTSLDNTLLRVEANSIFRILRTIEEVSGQRFLVTATGSYLDLIGQGMMKPRLGGESDDEYRARLIFNPQFWNDCTVDGIKQMIHSYYGIDIDEYDETRLVELYKQAAVFFNKEQKSDNDWEDYEGWVNPTSDFGAEWLGETTSPGAIEVHLKAFQDGEERFIKKRHMKERLMEIRAAGVVVFLYFHMTYGADLIPSMVDVGTEVELAQQDSIPSPAIYDQYELIITSGEVSQIIAQAKDELSGKLSKRIVHDKQKNKCNAQYFEDIRNDLTPYELAELEYGENTYRPEPFRFRQGRLRNDCWRFFYGVKYEERDITIPTKISIPLKAMINNESVLVGTMTAKSPSILYIVIEISGHKGNRTVYLATNTQQELYHGINSAIDLQTAMARSQIGEIAVEGINFQASLNQMFRKQYKKEPIVHTFYTRPNPMLDDFHHYRCDDVHGLDFYSVIEYIDFWWRVSTVQEGVLSVPSVPHKLTLAKIKEGTSDFWWRVTAIDGKAVSGAQSAKHLRIVGEQTLPLSSRLPLGDIDAWSYNVEQSDIFSICTSSSQMVILNNYNLNTSYQWNRNDIVSIGTSYTPERVVIAELNIGAISINDPYLPWVDSLLQADVVGGFIKIRAWKDEWFEFLKWRLDKIVQSGFHGILLSGLHIWGNDTISIQNMHNLVNKIEHYLHNIKKKHGFYILVSYDQSQTEAWISSVFLQNIDAVVAQSILDVNLLLLHPSYINMLNLFVAQHKPVFVVTDSSLASEDKENFIQQMRVFGFVPSI